MMALKKLFKSFVYAFSGICNCIKTCRNFRIHTVAAAFVLYLSGFYDFTPEKYALLFILIGLVLALECINTSLENICDAITKDYLLQIKKAKDAAAGAVLCTAIASVAVAVVLFWDKAVFIEIYNYFNSVGSILIVIVVLILSCIYIFYEDIFKDGKK